MPHSVLRSEMLSCVAFADCEAWQLACFAQIGPLVVVFGRAVGYFRGMAVLIVAAPACAARRFSSSPMDVTTELHLREFGLFP